MNFYSLLAALVSSIAVTASVFPLGDGFPSPSALDLQQIQNAAHGTISNMTLPVSMDDDTLTSIKVIAFNELFEVAFFTDLVSNITNKLPGFDTFNMTRIGDLKAIQAQEEIHAITANNILTHYNVSAIQPCDYHFPVSNLNEAFQLAATFTDLTIGILTDIQSRIAISLGPTGYRAITTLGQIIGQEGEQDGYFRSTYLGYLPSSQPFLTGAARAFFLSAIEPFYIAGSCPSLGDLQTKLPTFQPLTPIDVSQLASGTVTFFVDSLSGAFEVDPTSQKLVLINGANDPVAVDFMAEQLPGWAAYNITASFKAVQKNLYGLTIAAITNSTGPFTTPSDVADATVFGPGLIEFF